MVLLKVLLCGCLGTRGWLLRLLLCGARVPQVVAKVLLCGLLGLPGLL